jgi:hypothetical protein
VPMCCDTNLDRGALLSGSGINVKHTITTKDYRFDRVVKSSISVNLIIYSGTFNVGMNVIL